MRINTTCAIFSRSTPLFSPNAKKTKKIEKNERERAIFLHFFLEITAVKMFCVTLLLPRVFIII